MFGCELNIPTNCFFDFAHAYVQTTSDTKKAEGFQTVYKDLSTKFTLSKVEASTGQFERWSKIMLMWL